MPEKEKATVGKTVAGSAVSPNGNGAHPHDSIVFKPGDRAIWKNADHDEPVLITGMAGELQGVCYYTIDGSSTGIPEHELQPEPAEPASIMDELRALAEAAKVEPPAPAASEKPSDDLRKFLYSQAGLSDEGNAQCLNRLYAGRFLHNDAFGWLYWTGKYWSTEGAEAALDRATVATLLARIDAASQPETFEDGEKVRKFCLPNKGRVQGAQHMLKSLVVSQPAEFDAEPDLLNVANGVLNLRTGHLTAHDPSQRFTYCSPVEYKPAADWGPWVNFLENAAGPEQTAYLQLALGYTLTGHTREEILFYLYGPPRAGKGIYTETLQAVLGSPLAKEVNFGTFTALRTGDSQNFDLAPLKPCRMVAASESNSYERFNEAKLKSLTGGNEVYCAFKHHDLFNYRPQFKIWLSSNQPAIADPNDDAVWGRLRLIEFPHSHLGSEDKLLKERMRSPAVLEGVLAWAVQGAKRWYELGSQGLSEPATSVALKREQRESLDAVAAWLEERCIIGGMHFGAFTDLYQNYERWCKDSGIEPEKQKGLSTALQRKGFKAARESVNGKQARGFKGLKLDR